jgi:hypothetical protein
LVEFFNKLKMAKDVTRLLQDWRDGKKEALDELLPIVYDELRRVARNLLANEYAETLPTTALVHEAYLKLAGQHSVDWENRGQFFAIAASAVVGNCPIKTNSMADTPFTRCPAWRL